MQFIITAIVFSLVAIGLATAHVIWPSLGIDAVTISLLVLAAVPWVLPYLESIVLPGGVKIELKDVKDAAERVIEGASASSNTETPLLQNIENDLDTQIKLLRETGDRDPNLMMVGFRIEVEKRLIKLAKVNGFHLERTPLTRVINILRENEILPPQVASGLNDLIRVGNRAAHGAEVVPEAASWVLEVGIGVLRTLETLIMVSSQRLTKQTNH